MSMLNELKKNILVLDGAMGTQIAIYNKNSLDHEFLNISNSNLITTIHRKYINVGARIIETNTFNLAKPFLDGKYTYNEIKLITCQSITNCKNAIISANTNENIYIAGSYGPSHIPLKTISSDDNLIKEKLINLYQIQTQIFLEDFVDFLLIETVYDFESLKLILDSIYSTFYNLKCSLPIIISFTVNDNGNIYSGEHFEEIIKQIDSEYIIGYGFNCIECNEKTISLFKTLNKVNKKLSVFYPNLGTPNANNEYNKNYENIVPIIEKLIHNEYLNILGGCCGTDEKFIELISSLTKNGNPKNFNL